LEYNKAMNIKVAIVGVLVGSIILGIVFYFLAPNILNGRRKDQGPINLTIWGLLDEESLMQPIIDNYKKDHPNVNITYKKVSRINYRTRVLTQATQNIEGDKPDIYQLHDTWFPTFLQFNALVPSPQELISLADFQQSFYPVISEFLTSNGRVYGVPTNFDGLVLFYNEDILRAAGIIVVPQSWPELIADAVKTTVKDNTGIKTAGVALGTSTNVDYWSDILGLLFLEQPQASLASPGNQPSADILRFYTNFITKPEQKVWDVTMDSSTKAFSEGRLAFYFGLSSKATEFKKTNPNLNFKTAPVPQLPGKVVAWSSFWAYGVSPKSPNQEAAWEFLKYYSSAETQVLISQTAQAQGLAPVAFSRVSLQSQQSVDPIVGAVVNQAPFMKSWYLSSDTQDQGVNDEIIKLYGGAVSGVLQGGDPLGNLVGIGEEVKKTLTKYGVKNP
jgi:multiple sugar transport system substrate-binding protein